MKSSIIKGIPIVISAPSGAGKSTIAGRLLKDDIVLSISSTTRSPRKGEKNGVDYSFSSVDDFKRKIEKGEFLEWAVVHGNYYGTPLTPIRANLDKGKDVVMVIDPQGALSVKNHYPDGVYIFVVPPTWDILLKRIKERALDDKASQKIRIANARKELTYLSHYDYVVVNDHLKDAVDDVLAILRSEHLRRERIDKRAIPILN